MENLLHVFMYLLTFCLFCLPGYWLYDLAVPFHFQRSKPRDAFFPPIEMYFLYSLVLLAPLSCVFMIAKAKILYLILCYILCSFLICAVYFKKRFNFKSIKLDFSLVKKIIGLLLIFVCTSIFALLTNADIGSDARETILKMSNLINELDVLFGTESLIEGVRLEIVPVLLAILSFCSGFSQVETNFLSSAVFLFLSFLAWYRLFYTFISNSYTAIIGTILLFSVVTFYYTNGFFSLLSYDSTTMVTLFFPIFLRIFYHVLSSKRAPISEQYDLSFFLLLSGFWHKALLLHLLVMIPLAFNIYFIAKRERKIFKNIIRLRNVISLFVILGITFLAGELFYLGLVNSKSNLGFAYYFISLTLIFLSLKFSLNRKNNLIKELFESRVGFVLPLAISTVLLYLTRQSSVPLYSGENLHGQHSAALNIWGMWIMDPKLLRVHSQIFIVAGLILSFFSPNYKVRKLFPVIFTILLSFYTILFFPLLTTQVTLVVPIWVLDRIRYYFWFIGPFLSILALLSYLLSFKVARKKIVHRLLLVPSFLMLIFSVQSAYSSQDLNGRIYGIDHFWENFSTWNKKQKKYERIYESILENLGEHRVRIVGNTVRPFSNQYYRLSMFRGFEYVRSEEIIEKVSLKEEIPSDLLYNIFLVNLNERGGYFRERKNQFFNNENYKIIYHDNDTILFLLTPMPWSKILDWFHKDSDKKFTQIYGNIDEPQDGFLSLHFGEKLAYKNYTAKLERMLMASVIDPLMHKKYILIDFDRDMGRFKKYRRYLEREGKYSKLLSNDKYMYIYVNE